MRQLNIQGFALIRAVLLFLPKKTEYLCSAWFFIQSIFTNRNTPFGNFWEINFWPSDPKNFLRRLWCQYMLTLRGSARQKKNNFFVKIFQKVLKNGFLTCFFQKFACGTEIFYQNSVFLVLKESSENPFGQPKKNPLPSKNPTSAPDSIWIKGQSEHSWLCPDTSNLVQIS